MATAASPLVIRLVIGEPDRDAAWTTCPVCGRDTVLTFPIMQLTDRGFDLVSTVDICAGCYQAAVRAARDEGDT